MPHKRKLFFKEPLVVKEGTPSILHFPEVMSKEQRKLAATFLRGFRKGFKKATGRMPIIEV